ncbi:MAG: hypothetical protein AAFX90_17340 [Pseudomonadota bacterium]
MANEIVSATIWRGIKKDIKNELKSYVKDTAALIKKGLLPDGQSPIEAKDEMKIVISHFDKFFKSCDSGLTPDQPHFSGPI